MFTTCIVVTVSQYLLISKLIRLYISNRNSFLYVHDIWKWLKKRKSKKCCALSNLTRVCTCMCMGLSYIPIPYQFSWQHLYIIILNFQKGMCLKIQLSLQSSTFVEGKAHYSCLLGFPKFFETTCSVKRCVFLVQYRLPVSGDWTAPCYAWEYFK